MSAGESRGTIAALLSEARLALDGAGVESALLDSELLMAHALGRNRTWLIAHSTDRVPARKSALFDELLKRRLEREPLAYILGYKEFFGWPILVTRSVLIPRPETEVLVSRALELLDGRDDEALALDIGTGSGCIPIAILVSMPEVAEPVLFDATDCSADALAVAEENAEDLAVDLDISFSECDLFDEDASQKYDLIVSNPPYIPAGEIDSLPPEISRFEPREALNGGPDGLRVIARIIAEAPRRLVRGGTLLLEIGAGQSEAVEAMAREAGLCAAGVHPDLAAIPRVAEFRAK